MVWVAHPSFSKLDKHDELVICNYFQSKRKSGGGDIEDHKLMVDRSGVCLALLIRFVEAGSELT